MNYPIVELQDICRFISGGTPSTKVPEYFTGTIPWITGADVHDNVITRARQYITKQAIRNSATNIVSKGNILLVTRTGVGKVAIAGVDICISQDFTGLELDKTKVDEWYLFFFLRSQEEALTSQQRGATIQGITRDVVESLQIPIPPLSEQHRIAALLRRADHLRRMQRYADGLSGSLLQSVFLEMFGNPVRNERGWEVYYLAELCESNNGIKAGPFGSSLKKEIYTKSGYRIFGQEQVIGGSFSIGDYYISKEMFEKDFKAYEVRPNDVLISLVGTFGKAIIVPDGITPGIINPRLVKISPRKNKLNSVYLAQYLQLSSVQKQFLDLSHGGTMGILNAGQLKEFKIICPPLSEQERFAGVVRRVEALRRRQAEARRQAEGLFESLLSQSFGGGS